MTSPHRLPAFAVLAATIAGCASNGAIDRASLGGSASDAPVSLKPAQAASIQVALGRSLEKDGDLQKAGLAYIQALRIEPKNVQARLRLAILLDRAGKFAEAAEHYEKALKADPGNPDIFCDRGYSLSLQGKDAEAEIALRQAIALRPDHARAHNNLGLVLARAGREEEARREFLMAGGAEADARANLAFGQAQARRWDDAKKNLALARASEVRGSGRPAPTNQLAAMIDVASRTAATKDGALSRASATIDAPAPPRSVHSFERTTRADASVVTSVSPE